MPVATANIAQLKARLSEYLRKVKSGQELVVTERGVPVAKLVPLGAGERRATRRDRLTRAGVLRPGRGHVRKSLHTAPGGPGDGGAVLAALIAERRNEDAR